MPGFFFGEEGGVAEGLVNVLGFQVGIGLEDAVLGFSRGEEAEEPEDGEAQASPIEVILSGARLLAGGEKNLPKE